MTQSISFLKNDQTTVIFHLTPGKYDKSHLKQVAQAPQKGATCYFYAMKIIRNSYDNASASNFSQSPKQKAIEKECSAFRKKITCLTTAKATVTELLNQSHCQGTTKNQVLVNRNAIDSVIQVGLQLPKKDKTPLVLAGTIFYNFLQQGQTKFDDIVTYATEDLRIRETYIELEFLKSMGINFEEESEKYMKIEINDTAAGYPREMQECIEKDIKENYADRKQTSLGDWVHAILVKSMADMYGFQKASWNPSENIFQLQNCLKKQGPLLVEGLYGHNMYSKEPSIKDTIENRSIYGWGKGERILSNHYLTVATNSNNAVSNQFSGRSHMIVVVGASKIDSKGEYVYYVDPTDGSDPKNLEQQKIYMLSYETFKTHVSDALSNLYRPDLPNLSVGYAFYFPGNRETASSQQK